MKTLLKLAMVAVLAFALGSCDKEDDKMDGMEACEQAAGRMLKDVEECLYNLGYTLGDDPEDMAEEFCEDECDDIDKKVDESDVDDCVDAIKDLDCDELLNAFLYEDEPDIDECEWMEKTLGCY